MLTTLIAFVVALAILIAVHEWGHYRMAVACGVKVLRFSVGFGKPLLRWQPKNSPTEFVVGMVPLGGYVRMLDEREAPVDPAERHQAFNNRPLRQRAAIVAVDVEGMAVAEAARLLGVAEGTVKSRRARARLRLAEVLGHLKEARE